MEKMESSLKCMYPALPKTERARSVVLGGAGPESMNKDTFLYCSGKNVFIRDINKPDVCELFSTHAYKTTVAKYNQNGKFIASGDESGKVLVWDVESEDRKLQGLTKMEIMGLGGTIKDIAWGPQTIMRDLQVAFCGEGSSVAGRVVGAMDGTNKGALTCHTKGVNSISYRPKRLFRVVTASEDNLIYFFEGPPFKFVNSKKDHTNFVNCVRYSPDGELFISGGQDGKAYIYDGDKGEKIGELVDENVKVAKFGQQASDNKNNAHSGGIYAIDFSDDGTEVLTVSGDKSAKIWNVASRQLVAEFNMGKDVRDQQLGCLWQGEHIMTVSGSGYINYLDRSNPTNGKGVHTPLKVLRGHNNSVTSMVVAFHQNKLFTGGNDGLILAWDLQSGLAEEIEGKGHTNKINDMRIVGDMLVTVSVDDFLRYTNISGDTYQYSSNFVKLPSQPRGVAVQEGPISVVACQNHIVVIDSVPSVQYVHPVPYETLSIDISGRTVAVGSSTRKVFIFELDSSSYTLREVSAIDVEDEVTDVKFSPDGTRLAVGTAAKKLVQLYSVDSEHNFKLLYSEGRHTAKVFTLSWSPNSEYFASGSVDGCVTIWCKNKIGLDAYLHVIKGAHYKGDVQKVVWVSDDVLATCGGDFIIKQFNVRKV